MVRTLSDRHHRPDSYCHTCHRDLHHLGVASHRASHRNRSEDCEITYSDGLTSYHAFSRRAQLKGSKDE